MIGQFKIFTRARCLELKNFLLPPVFRESWNNFSLKSVPPIVSFCGFGSLGSAAIYFINTYSNTASIAKDTGIADIISDYMPSKIKTSIPNTSDYLELVKNNKYVKRPSIEKELLSFTNRTKTESDGIYLIVYGAKGAGKSIVADAVISGRPGILKVKWSCAGSKYMLLQEINKLIGISKSNPSVGDYKEALRKSVSSTGILPTVIFEIETGGNKVQILGIHAARGLSKEWASVCNCIIILSEAGTVVEFGKDRSREQYIFVDELDEGVARAFIKQNQIMLSEDEKDIKKVIDNIGCNPATLESLRSSMKKGVSLDDSIASVLLDAESQLVGFQHQPILKALKDHPEGISPEFFNKLENKGVDLSNPKAVGVSMRGGNVLTYRKDLRKYMTYSKAIEVALRIYDPIMPEAKTAAENLLNPEEMAEIKSMLKVAKELKSQQQNKD